MNPRIAAELALLRQHYDEVRHSAENGLHWFWVSILKTPDGWSPDEIPAAFAITEGHPGAPPYGFFVPAALHLGGKPPSETNATHPPPFDGEWRFLSWQAEGWKPAATVRTGSNLWGWVRSFMDRLCEGL